LARLIRRPHDAAQGWIPPEDAVWATLPGTEAIPLLDGDGDGDTDAELVSHRGYCPGNVVIRDGLPAALIDFDLARPTTRIYDLANALYWWAPLLHPTDRAPALVDADIPRFHLTSRGAAEADPVFRRFWQQGVKDRMPRAEAWLAHEGPPSPPGSPRPPRTDEPGLMTPGVFLGRPHTQPRAY
jgi:hypothetical protein